MIQYKCSQNTTESQKEEYMNKLQVLEYEINTKVINEEDYVSLTDIAKKVNGDEPRFVIQNWMRNKDTYYDMLTRVRTHNDMIAWIKFFLEAVIETSKTAKEKFRNVVELTIVMDKVIMDLPVKPENAKKVLDVLYDEPIVSRKKILELIDIKPTTLNVCINALKEKNIIIETTGYSRNQVFAFQKYIDLFLK